MSSFPVKAPPRRQVRAKGSERPVGKEIETQPGGAADIGQRSGIRPKYCPPDDDRQQEIMEIQPIPDFRADTHARREKGKTEHDQEHGPESLACRGWNSFQRIISVHVAQRAPVRQLHPEPKEFPDGK